MFYFDTHCHLICPQYSKQFLTALIKGLAEKEIRILNCGTDFISSKKGIDLAKKYKNILTAVGLCPQEVAKKKFPLKNFKNLIHLEKVSAIGEIGLDFFYCQNKKAQEKSLIFQLKLAQKYNLPVSLHCRGSKQNPMDAFICLQNIVTKYPLKRGGVLHSFSGSLAQARNFIKLNYFLGVNGIITYKNASSLREIIKKIPLQNIVLETDSPYLSPEPLRGRLNRPDNIIYIAKALAVLKNESIMRVKNQTTKNALKLFNLC